MSGCAKSVREFINAINKRIAKRLNNGAVNGMGRRLWPPRTTKNDTNTQFRFDQGHIYGTSRKSYDIILQANREAKSHAVRKFAQKNPHAILAKMRVNCEEGEVSVKKFKTGLRKDFERRERERNFY